MRFFERHILATPEFYPVTKTGRRKKKPGRPRGAKTETVTVIVVATACPRCGSTRRTKFQTVATRRGPFPGRVVANMLRSKNQPVAPGVESRIFAVKTSRRCKCLDCNQIRTEQGFS